MHAAAAASSFSISNPVEAPTSIVSWYRFYTIVVIVFSYHPHLHEGWHLQGRFSVGHLVLIAVLKEAREEAGLSQRKLSGALGRAANFVNFIETGQHIPNSLEFRAYADVLGMSPEKLMARWSRRLKTK
jgi:hypothetical protein